MKNKNYSVFHAVKVIKKSNKNRPNKKVCNQQRKRERMHNTNAKNTCNILSD